MGLVGFSENLAIQNHTDCIQRIGNYSPEISKEGDIYYAKITLPSGEVISLENEDFEEVLEQVANDLQERFGS